MGYNLVALYDETNNKAIGKLIHRLVLHAFENNKINKPYVDHIDNNPLNNCLFNLRFATIAENQHNKSLNRNNSSGVKGVSWRADKNKWSVSIYHNSKKIHVGYFDKLKSAQQARQAKANELFGEFIHSSEILI